MIFGISIALLSTTSCTKKRTFDQKTLQLVIGADVKGMDPIFANDTYSSGEVARIYEGLLEYNYVKRPYTLTPNLAESMPEVSTDGLTYTFNIKKGVYFHDDQAFPEGKGRELEAQDFVFSIQRLADPKLQGLGWWLIDGKILGLNEWRDENAKKEKVDYSKSIPGLVALDKYTLQFKLVKPFPQFLYALAMSFTYAVPREVVEFYGNEFLNHPVGTGPYILPIFKQTKKIEYTRNPNFRKKMFPEDASPEFAEIVKEYKGRQVPLVDSIVVNVMTEDLPRWLSFKKGRLDLIGIPKDNFDSAVVPGKGLAEDMKNKGIELLIFSSLDITYTGFNHDLKLLQNKNLRKAMALAYDENEFNRLFFNNTALPAQSVIPPGIAGHEKDFVNPYREQNIELAKEYLAKAGYPEGKGLPEITYDCPNSSSSRQTGELFKKQMAKIGINITVMLNSWPELQNKITKRNIMTYGIGWVADYPDAENFLQLLYGPNRAPGANGSGYDNPEFNAIFKKASVMQDGPERTALYKQLNRLVADEMPWIFGNHRQSYVIKHGWIKNYIPTDFNHGVAQYWDVDLEKKSLLTGKM